MHEYLKVSVESVTGIRSEIKRYIAKKENRTRAIDILQIRRNRRFAYPRLHVYCKKALLVPVKGVHSESIFSHPRNIITNHRQLLRADMAKMLAFCI